jgi:putative transposase
MVGINRAKKFSHREEKGQAIAKTNGHVIRIDEHAYKVKSQSSDGEEYDVLNTELGFICSCSDHIFRGVKCKHIYAVEFSHALRNKVESQVVIKTINVKACPRCQSYNIVKHGVRHNKAGDIQRFFCNDCGKWFMTNLGFEKMHATPKMITAAMQLYFSGESLRNVQRFLKLQGVDVSHMAVYRWIKRYVALMQDYLEQIQPKVSGAWRTDELYLKIKGNTKYLYALMDDETRFWIAQQVADTKYTADVRPLFKEGKEVTGKRPAVIISDGAPNFHTAYNKEFFTARKPRTRHIAHVRLQGDHNNNKMERMNGEIRDREKTMRGLKKVDTPILTGYQIYHNYMRPHESLGAEITPAEACGIKVEGQNKWMTLIQNAAKLAQGNDAL